MEGRGSSLKAIFACVGAEILNQFEVAGGVFEWVMCCGRDAYNDESSEKNIE